MAGFYVFTLVVRVSVRSPFVRPSFPFDTLSIYKRDLFKFCICICAKNVSLGIVNGQISIIYHRVMALVNGQKMVFKIPSKAVSTCPHYIYFTNPNSEIRVANFGIRNYGVGWK